MSGLEAFSLACNVMTVITFSLETAKICRTIKKSGSSNPDLQQNTSHRQDIFNDVEQVLKRDPAKPTDAEKRLRALATECMGYAKAVQEELDYTSGQGLERFTAVRATFRTVRRKSRIDECAQRLEAAKSTLDSALLAEIFKECMQSKGSKVSIYDKLSKQQKDLLNNNHMTRELLVEFRASEETQAYEKLLRSLKYDQMNSRKTGIPHRHESTFEWVFSEENPKNSTGSGDNTAEVIVSSSVSTSSTMSQRQDEHDLQENMKSLSLVQWLQKDCRCLYWVNGKPGSGKSTFMKFIENDERTKKALQDWQPKCKIVSHFLWKPGTEDQQSLKGMLCSLFYQALCNERDIALQILRNTPGLTYKDGIADWDIEDLKRLLFTVFRCSSSPYLVLLDGLDELSQSDRGLTKLFPLLESLTAMGRIKLCVSSRPERPFSDKFESFPSLRMQDLTKDDITRYTVDFLEELQLHHDEELHQKVLAQIVRGSEGVFIWVYVVLQSVKHGIEQYGETWDDIHERITQLPPDIMKLYKDMLSRSGEKNEKYVKKAARYFQYIRTAWAEDKDIVALALVADDDVLDAFTRPNEIPCVERLVEMCQTTSTTLTPVSKGLLEVAIVDPGYRASASKNELRLWPWISNRVDFVHRSAKDFLHSAEGKELFEEFPLENELPTSQQIKAQLALRAFKRTGDQPLLKVWRTLSQERRLHIFDIDWVPQNLHGILSLVHRCAANESRGLVRPPSSISHEDFFLFEASYFGFYEYVTEALKSRGDYHPSVLIYVLFGACKKSIWTIDISVLRSTRYLFIRDLLQWHSQSVSRNLKTCNFFDASEGIMLAWNCFLVHALFESQPFVGTEREIVKEVLEIFIGSGVMQKSPEPRYLLAINFVTQLVMKWDETASGSLRQDLPYENSSVYIEVNDAYLLATLSRNNSGTSELILTEAKNPVFIRPILADSGTRGGKMATFFHIEVQEDDEESFKEWIFKKIFKRSRSGQFPDHKPSWLKAVPLGEFETPTQALEKIGYDLPEMNSPYDLLYEWTGY